VYYNPIGNYGNVDKEVPFESLRISRLSVVEVFPKRKVIHSESNVIATLENGVYKVPYEGYKTGWQYEIRLEKGTFACAPTTIEEYPLLDNKDYIQRVRVVDFEISGIDIEVKLDGTRTIGKVIIHGNHFSTHTVPVTVDGFTVEHRTNFISIELSLWDSITGEEISSFREINNIELEAKIFSNTKVIIDNINLEDFVGVLKMNLEIRRECVCVNPSPCSSRSPCSCDLITSIDKQLEPALFYGGGRLIDYTIGTITCTSSCYILEDIKVRSCCLIDPSYMKPFQYKNKCYASCDSANTATSLFTRRTNIAGSIREVCEEKCRPNEYKVEDEKLCEYCDSSCKSCSNAGPTNCLTCNEDFLLTYGVCVKGIINSCREIINFEAKGYIHEYIKRANPISLIATPVFDTLIVKSIKWEHEGSSSDIFSLGNSEGMIVNLTYEFVFRLDEEKPLNIKVNVEARDINNNIIACNDVLTLNHTLNIKGVVELVPSEGIVEETEFAMYLRNFILLKGLDIKATLDYVNETIKLVEDKLIKTNYRDTIEYSKNGRKEFYDKSGRLPDWSLLYTNRTEQFLITVTMKRAHETLIAAINITLHTEHQPTEIRNILITILHNLDTSFIKATNMLARYVVTEHETKVCIRNDDCRNEGSCINGVCKCKEGYSGNSCRYFEGTEDYILTLKERLKEYIENGICDYSLRELEAITINMAKVSEHLNEDLTGDLSTCFEEIDLSITKISDLEFLIHAISSLINVKVNHMNINEDSINELKKIINKKLGDAFDYIESPLMTHYGNFKSLIGSYKVSSDKASTFYLDNSGTRVIVPSSILAGVSNKGYAKLRMIEWKYNPYRFIKDNISSSLLSFSFIDQENNEIILPNDQIPIIPAITLYISLSDTNTSNELTCVYYDTDEKDFFSAGCLMAGIEEDKGICKTTHLTEFAISNAPYGILIAPIKIREKFTIQFKVLY